MKIFTFSLYDLTNVDLIRGKIIGRKKDKIYIEARVPHAPEVKLSGFAYYLDKVTIGGDVLLKLEKEFKDGSFRFKLLEMMVPDDYVGSNDTRLHRYDACYYEDKTA